MADYITFAEIRAVRRGVTNQMLIEPPSFLTTFPNIKSFGSSLLLKEHFTLVDEHVSGKQEW